MNLAEWQTRVLEGMRWNSPIEGLFQGPLENRFSVYQEGYWLRVCESLKEDFPLTERLFGVIRFEALIRDFLATERVEWELELGEVSPAFAAWLESSASPALMRSLKLDLLAVSSRRAPEAEGISGYGLHPSARFFRDGARGYVLWRFEGSVLRERLDSRTERLLALFREPADLEALRNRIEILGDEPEFVQDAVATWTEAGLICEYTVAADALIGV
jgi:hypothetical protein